MTCLYFIKTIILLLLIVFLSQGNGDNQFKTHEIFLKNHYNSHTVSDKFLSFGLDSSLLESFPELPIYNNKFINLVHHLKSAYIRIGGTAADCLYFNQTKFNKNLTNENKKYCNNKEFDIRNFILKSKDFLSLFEFSRNVGSRILFDLNTLFRNPDGSWNSNNAQEIILFAKGHGLELDWQMGNEPNSFRHVFNVSVSPVQLAKDYCSLRKILNKSGYKESILVGPDSNHIGDDLHNGENFVNKFLKKVGACVDYVTWHQYNLNGHIATKEDFLNSTVFDHFPKQIKVMKKLIKSSGLNISMWITETGSAFGGGAPNLSDKYLAGLLWLDKLGSSAKAGVQVVIRQSLFGNHYAMIGPDLEPNPDWWMAVMFKNFVSNVVLELHNPWKLDKIRIYAHCALKGPLTPETSRIVIYGINLNDIEKKVYFKNLPEKSKIFSYILSSNDIQSRNIYLNGNILKLHTNGSLPFFNPKIFNASQSVKLPSYSMFFLLFDETESLICN